MAAKTKAKTSQSDRTIAEAMQRIGKMPHQGEEAQDAIATLGKLAERLNGAPTSSVPAHVTNFHHGEMAALEKRLTPGQAKSETQRLWLALAYTLAAQAGGITGVEKVRLAF
ncbi:MAG: hypothetical protein IPP14_11555 [Planctomycetes bacterium]|nr:hypothetical protein [Planctomycetota bacterium]